MCRKVAFEINRLLLLSILDIFGKVETNFPSESYPPGFKYSPQTPRILKENQMISFFALCVFSSLEIFILPLIQASSQLYICRFFVIGQWKKSSRKKPHYQKALRRNLVFSKIHRNINKILGGERRIIILVSLHFIGLSFFWKNRIFCNVRTEIVHTTYFFWWCVQIKFTIILISYHWLPCMSVKTYFVQMYIQIIFSLCCSR